MSLALPLNLLEEERDVLKAPVCDQPFCAPQFSRIRHTARARGTSLTPARSLAEAPERARGST